MFEQALQERWNVHDAPNTLGWHHTSAATASLIETAADAVASLDSLDDANVALAPSPSTLSAPDKRHCGSPRQ